MTTEATVEVTVGEFLLDKLRSDEWYVYSFQAGLITIRRGVNLLRNIENGAWVVCTTRDGVMVDLAREFAIVTGTYVPLEDLIQDDRWVNDDGGRAAAGYPVDEDRGDCPVRSIAIATGMDYRLAHELIDAIGKTAPQWYGYDLHHADASNGGAHSHIIDKVLSGVLGWKWHRTSRRFALNNWFPTGPVVVLLHSEHHVCAVIDRVIHDTWDSSEGGRATIDGYWAPPIKEAAK